jgi:hypothetical protein
MAYRYLRVPDKNRKNCRRGYGEAVFRASRLNVDKRMLSRKKREKCGGIFTKEKKR